MLKLISFYLRSKSNRIRRIYPVQGYATLTSRIMASACCRREILVRGKPTEFLSIGPSLDEKPKKIILIIPGNPGVASYYKDFMQYLHNDVSQTHAVWAVSHAGHSPSSDLSFWPGDQHLYNLEDQIQHKIAFITDYVPKGTQISLVGHSIGSYIILRIIKAFANSSEAHVDNSYLLFPTIERMKITPNGHILWPLLCYFRWLTVLLTFFAYLLPCTLKRVLLSLYFRGKEVSECSMQATIDLLHPKIIQNVLWMAYNELSFIDEADIETIEQHKDKLVFYYGATDGWCPQSYRTELLAKVNGLKAFLCENGYPHAFVLGCSEGMAKKVSSWIMS